MIWLPPSLCIVSVAMELNAMVVSSLFRIWKTIIHFVPWSWMIIPWEPQPKKRRKQEFICWQASYQTWKNSLIWGSNFLLNYDLIPISLQNNQISDSTLSALAKSLETNRTLSYLGYCQPSLVSPQLSYHWQTTMEYDHCWWWDFSRERTLQEFNFTLSFAHRKSHSTLECCIHKNGKYDLQRICEPTVWTRYSIELNRESRNIACWDPKYSISVADLSCWLCR